MTEIQTPTETLPVTWVARGDVLPNDWNPNSMSEGKRQELVHSIVDNGWTQPIVVNPETDEIIDGEQRWKAAGDARVKKRDTLTPDGIPAGHIPVFYLDVDETQSRVATLQHNIDGDTNTESLGRIFADLDDDGLFYDAAERFQIGETGIDRLIEQATSETETPDTFETDGEATVDEPADPEPFTESLEFQMTADEAEDVRLWLADVDLVDLCEWAIEESVHTQTRVDMRLLAERDPAFEAGESVVEYPSVDMETHLGRFYRGSDPTEVTSDE